MIIKLGNVTVPKNNITAAPEVSREIDAALLTLPIDTLSLTVHRFDGFPEIKKGLPVNISDDDGKNTDVFFVKAARKMGADSYSLTCHSWLGKLSQMEYGGKIYLSPAPFGDIVADIMNDSGVPYSIDATLRSKTASGYIAAGSKREALQQLLFAVSGMIASKGENGIAFVAPVEKLKRTVTEDEIGAFPKAEYSDSSKSVTVAIHKYVKALPRDTDSFVVIGNNTYIVSTDTLTLSDIRASLNGDFIEDYSEKRIKNATMLTYDNFSEIVENVAAVLFNDDKYVADAIFDPDVNVGEIAEFPLFDGETFTGRIEEKTSILGALNKSSISANKVVASEHLTLTINYANKAGEIVHRESLFFPVPCKYTFKKAIVKREDNNYISAYIPPVDITGETTSDAETNVSVKLCAQLNKSNKTLSIFEASRADQTDDLVTMG